MLMLKMIKLPLAQCMLDTDWLLKKTTQLIKVPMQYTCLEVSIKMMLLKLIRKKNKRKRMETNHQLPLQELMMPKLSQLSREPADAQVENGFGQKLMVKKYQLQIAQERLF